MGMAARTVVMSEDRRLASHPIPALSYLKKWVYTQTSNLPKHENSPWTEEPKATTDEVHFCSWLDAWQLASWLSVRSCRVRGCGRKIRISVVTMRGTIHMGAVAIATANSPIAVILASLGVGVARWLVGSPSSAEWRRQIRSEAVPQDGHGQNKHSAMPLLSDRCGNYFAGAFSSTPLMYQFMLRI